MHHSVAFALLVTLNTTLVCRQVQDVTHDVKTFLFAADEPALFQHEPGQYMFHAHVSEFAQLGWMSLFDVR